MFPNNNKPNTPAIKEHIKLIIVAPVSAFLMIVAASLMLGISFSSISTFYKSVNNNGLAFTAANNGKNNGILVIISNIATPGFFITGNSISYIFGSSVKTIYSSGSSFSISYQNTPPFITP